MKFICKIKNKYCDINVFEWKHKFLVKFEYGSLEQILEISMFETRTIDELRERLNDDLIMKIMKRFDKMKILPENINSEHCG